MPWALTSNARSVPPPFLVVGTIPLFLLTLLTSRRDILFTSLENLATSVKTTILKYRLDSFQIKIFISFRQSLEDADRGGGEDEEGNEDAHHLDVLVQPGNVGVRELA
jgi:hypothetical protein